MYQEDYVKRLIQQVSQAVGKLLADLMGIVQAGEHYKALEQLSTIYHTLFNLSPEIIKSLTPQSLIEVLTDPIDGPDLANLILLAELLIIEGNVHTNKEDHDQAAECYLASLELFLELASQFGYTTDAEEASHIDDLAEYFSAHSLNTETRLKIFSFYELDKQYGKAEDQLFELVDDPKTPPETIQAGIAFYQRLLELNDAELEAGEIYREEVKEGLNELLERGNN